MSQSQHRPETGRGGLLARSRHQRPTFTMAAHATPPPPTDHPNIDIFSFHPPHPPTMPPNGAPPPDFGVDFGFDGAMADLPPLLPPPANLANDLAAQQQATNAQAQNGGAQPAHENEHEDSSDDEDGDDSEGEEADRADAEMPWHPILEEQREYVEDELRYWKDTKENSAEDHDYWESETFTDLKDPELQPGASGRIDFHVERFNGTREKPNKETVMRSEVVHIGGYDWRLKLYPRGNNTTDQLSVYLENVTMQAVDWDGSEEFANPPLPFLASSTERPRKRRCVAAQVCVVVYNPTEPRQFEHRVDAHQFTKDSPDYGWTRFCRTRRRDLGMRNHFQRAALLQDDKLAFKAYIRVVNDPTGCLWDHTLSKYSNVVNATALRPFYPVLPILAADLVLMHFAPFRELVYKWQQEQGVSKFVTWMNTLMWKMLSREKSEAYGDTIDCEQSDPVIWLYRAMKYLREEQGEELAHAMLGSLDPYKGGAVSGNRLQTKMQPSIQAAVDAHESPLDTPVLLTLELQRQHFDKEKRQWKRVTNKVEMENEIKVGGMSYKLFAFITHCGDLSSNTFKTYVRPGGPDSMWYGYSNDRVTCMTHKKALDRRCGENGADQKRDTSLFSLGRDRRGSQFFHDELEVAHVVFYVREDHAAHAFTQTKEIDWSPPSYIKGGKVEESASKEQSEATVVQEKEVPQDLSLNRTSVSNAESDYDIGCATPKHWFTDDDGDVVMSDMEDDDVAEDKAADGEPVKKVDSGEPELVQRTVDSLGCDYYSGQMRGSHYHGQGHLITLNGDEYAGSFSHGDKNGSGKMIYAASGDIYEGEWAEGQRHGKGKYIEASTGNVFDGNWKEDKKTGAFVLTGEVTEEDRGVCGICYEREMNTAFYDCGHVIACNACASMVEECPVCRRRIVSRLQLFGVRVSLE